MRAPCSLLFSRNWNPVIRPHFFRGKLVFLIYEKYGLTQQRRIHIKEKSPVVSVGNFCGSKLQHNILGVSFEEHDVCLTSQPIYANIILESATWYNKQPSY